VKVHLVDGTLELFRCFHGAPPAEDADGNEVGAVRGLLQTLAALLRQDDVTHVAVAFDTILDPPPGTGSPAAGRRGPSGQHALAAEAARALGLVIWPMAKRFEADEALASGARCFKDAAGVEQVVICTTDKDLFQCVEGEHVVVQDRIRKIVYDEPGVIAKFGVPPKAIAEYLGLVGDPADRLPGIPGWGKKSTGTVLTHYGTIEAIPDDAAEWTVTVRGAERLAASLRERRKEAILYRNLAVLRDDVPLPHTLEDLEWRGADRAVLEAFAQRIGAETLLERIPRWRT
jgi:5'-3' exonuclease